MGGPIIGRVLLLTLCILLIQLPTPTTSTHTRPLPIPKPTTPNTKFIKASCNSTSYPYLCYRSLAIYASKIQANPEILAHTALNVSLTSTKSTSRLMRRLSRIKGLRPREAAAVVDCVELVADSVDELQRSMGELDMMGKAKGSRFEYLVGDVQTWVSASLTDDSTCMDGFSEARINGNVKIVVRKHILRIGRLTSNALALINSYVSSRDNFS